MPPTSTDRRFQDWSRVQTDGGHRQGVIVWDPTLSLYRVLYDDNGWEEYTAGEAKARLSES